MDFDGFSTIPFKLYNALIIKDKLYITALPPLNHSGTYLEIG